MDSGDAPSESVARVQEQSVEVDVAERLMIADELARLDPVPREVMALAFYGDMTHTEIADSTGLPLGTVFTILYVASLATKNRGLRRFSSSVLLPWMVPGVSNSLSALRFLLLRHGFTFAVIALAGPLFGTRREEVKAKGVDVMVALDVSNSMLAKDLSPNRMEVAKRGLMLCLRLLRSIRTPANRLLTISGRCWNSELTQSPQTKARLSSGIVNWLAWHEQEGKDFFLSRPCSTVRRCFLFSAKRFLPSSFAALAGSLAQPRM